MLFLLLAGLLGDLRITEDQELTYLASTVRVVDHSERKGGVGTGAIVGTSQNGIFVLTAFHVIDPGVGLQVQWFDRDFRPTTCDRVTILAESPEADLGLLFVETSYRPPQCLQIFGSTRKPRQLEEVLSIGCSAGEVPSMLSETLKGEIVLRRPVASRSFWLTSQPAIGGRSGGPLIDAAGYVIGICRGGLAADADNPAEGLYSSLEEIHALLDVAKLTTVLLEPTQTKRISTIASNVP